MMGGMGMGIKDVGIMGLVGVLGGWGANTKLPIVH